MKKLIAIIMLVCLTLFSFTGCSGIVEVESEALKLSYDEWSILSGRALSFEIELDSQTEGRQFVFHACDGVIRIDEGETSSDSSSNITAESGQLVIWSAHDYDVETDTSYSWNGTQTFLEVMIMEDESYVGYAVIKIVANPDSYNASVVKCVEFPEVDGQRQEVTLEWLENRIEEVRRSA